MVLSDHVQEFSVVHNAFYDAFEKWRKSFISPECKSGVYTLKSNIPVQRVLGEDIAGVLYIGKGVILSPLHRLGNLINALNNTDTRHEAGTRYNERENANIQTIEHFQRSRYRHKYPLEKLVLRIELLEQPEVEEHKRLCAYLNQFGELPPLNRRV